MWLGTVAFGGPAAHLAMMEDEIVHRRHWLTRDPFLDLIGAANLIPGPNSTEVAIHVGYIRAGWAGLLVAGSCFIPTDEDKGVEILAALLKAYPVSATDEVTVEAEQEAATAVQAMPQSTANNMIDLEQ